MDQILEWGNGLLKFLAFMAGVMSCACLGYFTVNALGQAFKGIKDQFGGL